MGSAAVYKTDDQTTALSTHDIIQFTFTWLGIVLTLAVVLNKLYIRIISRWGWEGLHHRKAWTMSDILVCLAWIFTLERAIYTSIFYAIIIQLVKEQRNEWQPENLRILAQLQYIDVAVYWIPLYCIKGAMLLTYREFAPRPCRWLIIGTGIYCVVALIATLCIFLFGCLPISSRWTPHSPEMDKCMAERFTAYYIAIEGSHVLTDVLVFVIPFYILRYIKDAITKPQKISALIMFALGFVSIACSLVMAFSNLVNAKPILQTEAPPGKSPIEINHFMVIIEQSAAIWVACIPALRTSIRRLRCRDREPIEEESTKDMPEGSTLATDSGTGNVRVDFTETRLEERT